MSNEQPETIQKLEIELENARRLDFPTLARQIRQLIDNKHHGTGEQVSADHLNGLLTILESKLPPAPRKPELLKLPAPPEIPAEPKVTSPQYTPSIQFRHLEKDFDQRVAALEARKETASRKQRKLLIREIEQLRQKKTLALQAAEMSELPPEVANEWKRQLEECARWTHLKTQLLSSYKFQSSYVKLQNRNIEDRWKKAYYGWQRQLPVRITKNLRHELEDNFHSAITKGTIRIPWRFLPPSETRQAHVLTIIRDFQRRRPELRVDESRLRFAYGLGAEQVYIGQDEFDGYFAFVMPGGRKVLLENPIEGNAAYVFGSDWRSLSRLSKTDLITDHSGEMIRVLHKGAQWKTRIKSALRQISARH